MGTSGAVLWNAAFQLGAQPQSVSEDRLAQTLQQRQVTKTCSLDIVLYACGGLEKPVT